MFKARKKTIMNTSKQTLRLGIRIVDLKQAINKLLQSYKTITNWKEIPFIILTYLTLAVCVGVPGGTTVMCCCNGGTNSRLICVSCPYNVVNAL